MNTIVLSGHIGSDIEVKEGNTGKEYVRFSLAVRRNKEVTDWFDVVAFTSTAQFVKQWFSKGSWIEVSGSMQTSEYKDKEGKSRKSYTVMGNNVSFGNSTKGKETVDTNEFTTIEDSQDLPW